jgi:assimilatory nitrate reductase catalytic subunit
VKTHCCFCGQHCGIQLKVRDNQVIGFEPWEDFPFNRGMLCPKGVKRYLQGSHPDRLTTALHRVSSSASGFGPMPYDQAIAQVASELDRIQHAYGAGAIGVLGGASLTTEKTCLLIPGRLLHPMEADPERSQSMNASSRPPPRDCVGEEGITSAPR